MAERGSIFEPGFLYFLRISVDLHHQLYPAVPPQGNDAILMLRTIWTADLTHYQLIEIPVDLLRLIETANPQPVGRRQGRQSLGADVLSGNQPAFRVHFDASDGKCQIRALRVSDCRILSEWDKERPATAIVAERDPDC